MKGSYFFRVKGKPPYLIYSDYSISNLYQTVVYFLQFHCYHNYIGPVFFTNNHLKYNEHITFVTALYFINVRNKAYMKHGYQTDHLYSYSSWWTFKCLLLCWKLLTLLLIAIFFIQFRCNFVSQKTKGNFTFANWNILFLFQSLNFWKAYFWGNFLILLRNSTGYIRAGWLY